MTNIEMNGYIEIEEKYLEQAKRMVEEALFNLPFETYIEFE